MWGRTHSSVPPPKAGMILLRIDSRNGRRVGSFPLNRMRCSYARPFFAATAFFPATSHGRFGRSTAGLSRFSTRSYW